MAGKAFEFTLTITVPWPDPLPEGYLEGDDAAFDAVNEAMAGKLNPVLQAIHEAAAAAGVTTQADLNAVYAAE